MITRQSDDPYDTRPNFSTDSFPLPTALPESDSNLNCPFRCISNDLFTVARPPERLVLIAFDEIASRNHPNQMDARGAWAVAKFVSMYPDAEIFYSHQGDGGIAAVGASSVTGFLDIIKRGPLSRVKILTSDDVVIAKTTSGGISFLGGSLDRQLRGMKTSNKSRVVGSEGNCLPDLDNVVQHNSGYTEIQGHLACIFVELQNNPSTEDIIFKLKEISGIFNKCQWTIYSFTVEGNVVKITAASANWSYNEVKSALGPGLKLTAFAPYLGNTLIEMSYPGGDSQVVPLAPFALLEAAVRNS